MCLCLSVQEPDEADALLKAERSHILTLKKTLEAQLRKVQTQLQVRPNHAHAMAAFAITQTQYTLKKIERVCEVSLILNMQ